MSDDTRNSDNQAGGYTEGMDHEIQPVSGEPDLCRCGYYSVRQPVSGEPEIGGVWGYAWRRIAFSTGDKTPGTPWDVIGPGQLDASQLSFIDMLLTEPEQWEVQPLAALSVPIDQVKS